MKSPKEKKKVPGWSIEEMKEKPNIVVEEHRRKCWTSSQNHKANDVEVRSTDSEGGRRSPEIV